MNPTATCERGWRDLMAWLERWFGERKKRRPKIRRTRVFFEMP